MKASKAALLPILLAILLVWIPVAGANNGSPGADAGWRGANLSLRLSSVFQWGEEGGEDEGWGEDEGGEDEGWGEDEGEDEGFGEEEKPEDKPEEEEPAEREGYIAGKMRKLSLSFYFNLSLPLSGDAGSATNSPTYDEAFSIGFGGGAMFGYRVMPALEISVAATLVLFPAAEFDRQDPLAPATILTNKFSSYMPISACAGLRLYFLIDRSAGDWFSFKKDKAQTGFTPYIGYLFGIGFHPAVEWVEPDSAKYPKCDYWDGGIILIQNLLFGAEVRFSPSMGLMFEGQIATYGAPSASSDPTANNVNEAGYMMAFQIRVGLTMAF
jgi:hypothetical protein